jgi:hypothetical protein
MTRHFLPTALTLFLAACASPTEPLERVEILEVARQRIACTTWYMAPITCLHVRNIPGGEWRALWDAIEIEGFQHQLGERVIIEVAVFRRRDYVLDAPNEIYRLRRYLLPSAGSLPNAGWY